MAVSQNLEFGLKHRIYWITKRIAQGQFATPKRAAVLRQQGVTDVLNVGDGASIVSPEEFGFRSVVDIPIVDLQLIPTTAAITATDALHRAVIAPGSRVFVHCVAGQNRSPTILWLYLVACGLSPDDARKIISDRNPDAVPGHPRLIDERLVNVVTTHGKFHYQPISDPSVLEPAYEIPE